ncbi:MAG: iron donor protein CyaY [Rhodospirillaceae bacterium]|jgi:frataxin|nr:iron donor protein CyaY [Rhodospirillaceae bacterium]
MTAPTNSNAHSNNPLSAAAPGTHATPSAAEAAPTNFEARAEQTLQRLLTGLEAMADRHQQAGAGGDYEVDWGHDVLTLTLPNGRQYVINKHRASQQIWVSSPISGGWHFAWDAGSASWQSTRTSQELLALLLAELPDLSLPHTPSPHG